jgi:hypothetical protein
MDEATSSSGVLYKVYITIGMVGIELGISLPALIPFARGILKSKTTRSGCSFAA